MSVVQNTLIGASKQKIGNAVFTTWKGINVLKSKPMSVANPQTDGQRQQRTAFAALVAAFRLMPAVIRAGFKEMAIKKSEFNAFMSVNIKNAFDFSVAGTATLIPENLVISRGTIANAAIISAVASRAANTIVVNYSHAILQPGQSVSDLAIIGAYNSTKNEWHGETTTALRSADTAHIVMPAGWEVGDDLNVYLGFYNALSGKSSDSSQIATTVVA